MTLNDFLLLRKAFNCAYNKHLRIPVEPEVDESVYIAEQLVMDYKEDWDEETLNIYVDGKAFGKVLLKEYF